MEIDEKEVYSQLRDDREIRKPKFKLGQLVRTSDIRKAFSKCDIQTTAITYIQSEKSFMTLYHHVESTIYPRHIIKIYHFPQNYLFKKTTK